MGRDWDLDCSATLESHASKCLANAVAGNLAGCVSPISDFDLVGIRPRFFRERLGVRRAGRRAAASIAAIG